MNYLHTINRVLAVFVLGASSAPLLADETPVIESAMDVITMSGMNVFRRHEVSSEKMFHFYGKVLGFDELGTYQLGNGGVTRFRVGGSELKFTGREAGRSYVAGGVTDATGLRLLSLYYPEQSVVEGRFIGNELPAPLFQTIQNRTSALVKDPDGQWVELVIKPGENEVFYKQIEVGLTVSDMDASRDFYRDFMGLEELEPVHDAGFNAMKYSFRLGNTTISLRSFGSDLPADTGSGGIQYVVSDAVAVDELAKKQGITIDQPLNILDGFNMYFLWLEDPDGITNYFAQVNAIPQIE